MESSTKVTVNTTTLSYTANSLFPNTYYTFEVAAVNNKGVGLYSNRTIQTISPKGKLILS